MERTVRDFRLGGVPFTCRQSFVPERYNVRFPENDLAYWRITCGTAPDERRPNLYASFVGGDDDLALFYKIIEGIKPVP
jgi:hypothetical protein